ncbi:hypothetical protein [Natronorubrum sp. DTA28]|uniref:hypothetical protein n=1 Tax=Natronorubrum sp. DTA28 TaxID=3447019 RepID=UPI003F877FA8
MVDDMYWGKCDECPPGKRYRYIPDSSDICLSCMEDRFDHSEYESQETPGQSYTQAELQEMANKSTEEKKAEIIKMVQQSRKGGPALPPSHRGDSDE